MAARVFNTNLLHFLPQHHVITTICAQFPTSTYVHLKLLFFLLLFFACTKYRELKVIIYEDLQDCFNKNLGMCQKLKFGIPNLPQSVDIEQNSDGSISHFRISGQFLTNKHFHNYRTSNDTDINQ